MIYTDNRMQNNSGVCLPALASDTALDIALLEIALFLFIISSNSASLRGARAASISLTTHVYVRENQNEETVTTLISS